MATILELAQKMQRGEVNPPPIGRLLGFVLKEIEPGRAVFEMEADERHHNPMGTLHGGVYCDLADAAMGYAYASTLAEGETFTTVELKINFLRAVRQGRLTAEARVVKAGSALGYVECDVTDQAGKLVARAASTCMKLGRLVRLRNSVPPLPGCDGETDGNSTTMEAVGLCDHVGRDRPGWRPRVWPDRCAAPRR